MKNINKYQYRYQLFSLLDKGLYTAMDVAWELNLSVGHVRKLLARFRANKKKLSTLLPKSRPSSWNGMTEEIINEIIRLKKEGKTSSETFVIYGVILFILLAVGWTAIDQLNLDLPVIGSGENLALIIGIIIIAALFFLAFKLGAVSQLEEHMKREAQKAAKGGK